MFGLRLVNEMESMQREMDQLFRGFGFSPDYGSAEKQINFTVLDGGESFNVEAPLPGLDIEKLDISVLGRRLTVSGEFSAPELPQDVRWHRHERNGGTFEKNLQLSADIDTEKIEAEYKQGILKINLPKAASALPKKIAIKVG
ncbi:MAG: Hsp20/alpha crystallin family protein [Thermodesulfobacteriota bacterium]|nr:Hsp20/alpha crystallin family protein [Thermodesulfobacteriota bacterium]